MQCFIRLFFIIILFGGKKTCLVKMLLHNVCTIYVDTRYLPPKTYIRKPTYLQRDR